ncbi:MAG: hypothetical protein K0R38_504 [Polyangiaceae bacterium]|nr:hypothetical protein [Polyangiaceae bacterium]
MRQAKIFQLTPTGKGGVEELILAGRYLGARIGVRHGLGVRRRVGIGIGIGIGVGLRGRNGIGLDDERWRPPRFA